MSFTWNTDGVAIFKSSEFNIWPFHLIINELPYSERFKPENMILAGIWFGNAKPLQNLFLKSFKESLTKLRQGVQFTFWNKTVVSVRAMIICGTCDLPAKAVSLNFKQHNGYFGCPRCKLEGYHINRVHVYPYKKKLNLRTTKDTIRTAELVTGEATKEV